MSVEIILNRESNIIMAEGHGSRWNFWNLSALGVMIGLAIFFGGLWFLLSRPIPIPADTAILAVISPKASRQILPTAFQEKIPGVCQNALASDSDWPIICGVTVSGQSFAITPRWLNNGVYASFTAGLVARSGEVAGETTPFRYTSALYWRGIAKQPGILVESSAIEKWLGLEVASTSTKILFRWNGRGFDSDLKLSPQTTPLPAGDIALALDRNAWDALPGDLFLNAVNLPDKSQWKPLPPIERYAVWLDADRSTEGRFIGFAEPLDQELAARVLGMMGVTERRALTLPDGTVSFERLLPTASTNTNLFGRRQNDIGQWVDLSSRFILVSNASSTLDQSNVAPCGASYPWLRLSKNVLNSMLGTTLPSLQAYSENNHLSICFEQ
ncbi:hypothetical protein K8R04_04050 [Candidatus Uhrbacteria bacterium]|nr:hypothetical protein [Candidatus Uhrbacteria bacterium]